MWTLFFLSDGKCSNCLVSAFTCSLNWFLELRTALFCRKFSCIFSSATFNSVTVLTSAEAFKKSFVHHSPDMISAWGSNLETCFFWILCRQFACRHCWVACVVCTQPKHLAESVALSSSSRFHSSIHTQIKLSKYNMLMQCITKLA